MRITIILVGNLLCRSGFFQLYREREREIERERERDRQTDRTTDRQTDRQIDRQTDRVRQTEREKEKDTHTYTCAPQISVSPNSKNRYIEETAFLVFIFTVILPNPKFNQYWCNYPSPQ